MLKLTEREILAQKCYEYFMEMNTLKGRSFLPFKDPNLSDLVRDSWIGVVTIVEIAIQDKKCNFPVEEVK